MEFKEGNVVEHVLTKDWFLVINVTPNEPIVITCRGKDYSLYHFYKYELKFIR